MKEEVINSFLAMREKWQPCVGLMPFFNYCAAHFPAKQPFSGGCKVSSVIGLFTI